MTRKHPEYDQQPYDSSTASAPAASLESTPEERARDLLASMTQAARHNSPVTPLMLSELAFLVGHVAGKPPAVQLHPVLDSRGLPGNVTFRKPDGGVEMVDTAEEALALLRGLPPEVQARPHWAAADKALTEAVASVPGSDVSPATRKFEEALARDRELEPRQIEIPPSPVKPPAPAPEPVPS